MQRVIDVNGQATVTGQIRYLSETSCDSACDFFQRTSERLVCTLYTEDIQKKRTKQCVLDTCKFKIFVCVPSISAETEADIDAKALLQLVHDTCSHKYSMAELALYQGLLVLRVQRPCCMTISEWATLVKELTEE